MACYLFEGMRRSEIIELTWDRVDLVNHIITLSDADVKTGRTTGGREIPINNFVHSLLVERLHLIQQFKLNTKFVFPNATDPKKPMHVHGFKSSWAKLIEKANLKDLEYTWHDFRATFEKYMHKTNEFTSTQKEKMAGASIDVQKRIYVSMTAEDLRGLEKVVQVPGLSELFETSSEGLNDETGKTRGEKISEKS